MFSTKTKGKLNQVASYLYVALGDFFFCCGSMALGREKLPTFALRGLANLILKKKRLNKSMDN